MSQPLVEGRDYYLENGLYVFTASYLEQRGFCCEANCRHCPYHGGRFTRAEIPPSDQKSTKNTPPSN